MCKVSQQESKPEELPKELPTVNLDDPPEGGSGSDDTFDEMQKAGKRGGLFGRFSRSVNEAIDNSRGTAAPPDPAQEGGDDPTVTADDLAIRRARHTKVQRMTVPDGVLIEGNMTSGSETEIHGRIEGDVTVEGRLHLGASALVTGNVRATTCLVEGLVEGRMECAQELELGKTGRLNAEVVAGELVSVAGKIFGNVASSGLLHLVNGCRVDGDLRAKRIVVEEGAVFNGRCAMRTPSQRSVLE
jgi:cytoskeletal protein CcmA (bactofilin family)